MNISCESEHECTEHFYKAKVKTHPTITSKPSYNCVHDIKEGQEKKRNEKIICMLHNSNSHSSTASYYIPKQIRVQAFRHCMCALITIESHKCRRVVVRLYIWAFASFHEKIDV